MKPSARSDELACRVLKLEQQIKAYEQLHAGELAELYHTLEECKRAITDALSEASIPPAPASHLNSSDQGPASARPLGSVPGMDSA